VRVFKTREFAKFARKEKISDRALCDAIDRAERGIVDADLGGGVIKQRVPRKGQGRAGGYRTIIVYRKDKIAFFVYGIAKNDTANVSEYDHRRLQILGFQLLGLTSSGLRKEIAQKTLLEIEVHEQKKISK
jgi:hypothetical protein